MLRCTYAEMYTCDTGDLGLFHALANIRRGWKADNSRDREAAFCPPDPDPSSTMALKTFH